MKEIYWGRILPKQQRPSIEETINNYEREYMALVNKHKLWYFHIIILEINNNPLNPVFIISQ